MDAEGEVELGCRRLVGHMASKAGGCLYCQATDAGGGELRGKRRAHGGALNFRTSPLFSEKERVGVVAMFGFLSRWNDSMATPLEPIANGVAASALKARGWTAGKHLR